MSNKVKLNQIIAVVDGKKSGVKSVLTKAYHVLQKPEPFFGLERKYQPKTEDSDKYPNESGKVQLEVKEIIEDIKNPWQEMFDAVLTNDEGNCGAKADIVIDEKVILYNVPVTTLIFLEKQLEDFKTLVSKLPVLPLSDSWMLDTTSGLHISDTVETVKTKKIERPIVLYDATPEHPAQAQLITEDIVVGHWKSKKLSSALPGTEIEKLLDRVVQLKEAVIKARVSANSTEIEQKKGGKEILDFIFG